MTRQRPTPAEMTRAWLLIFKPVLQRKPRSKDEQDLIEETMRREASANIEAFLWAIKGKPK